LLPSAHDQIEYLRVERCGGDHDGSPIAGLTKLTTLVMTDYRTGKFPEFDEAARISLHGRLVGRRAERGREGAPVQGNRAQAASRVLAGLAMCDADYCDCCGGRSDGE
jgi:hypothetical protein